ncbi:MAG TPA: pyruvate formate lyase family protein [Candidatus Lokiarchaeia archaeon]|nr:pyruvate formate lyase family protein [Candidatus Lokiarchaeia archaeon]
MQSNTHPPRKKGIKNHYIMDDFPQIASMREFILHEMPEICIERAMLKTKFLKETSIDIGDPLLREAEAMRYMLSHKLPLIFPGDLLAGSVTTKRKGVLLFPEFLATSIWPELMTISKRKQNPCKISTEDVLELNDNIFPFWSDKNMNELVRQAIGEDDPSYKLHQRLFFFMISKFNCQSHTIPDFQRVLDRGLSGLIQQARERMTSAQPKAKALYNAMILAMEGVIKYSENLCNELKEQALICEDSERRHQLYLMASICHEVPANPARTFREALQSIFTCLCALFQEQNNVGFSIGRLDQLLANYYQNDIESGTLTRDEAVELLAHFWLKVGSTTPLMPDAGSYFFNGSGANQAITIGGCDRDGNNAVNAVTYLCLDVTELVHIKDPNIIARIRSDDPPEYTRRVAEVIINTGSTPSLVNDDMTIEALQKIGISLEDAREYAHVGCVEPTSIGRTFGHTGAILLNLPVALELSLKTIDIQEYTTFMEENRLNAFQTFDAFMNTVKNHLSFIVYHATRLNNACGELLKSLLPQPLLNAVFEGPLETGQQLLDGGAMYNSSGIAFVGLADLIDSLYVIKKLVFEENYLDFPELIKILKSNFKENEEFREMVINKIAHFGNGIEEVDGIGKELVDYLYQITRDIMNYRHGPYNPGYWSVTAHSGFGRFSGAFPHGKKAKEPFASSLTPVSFASKSGPTAIIKSVTSLDHAKMPNGMALNMKFNKSLFNNDEKMDVFVDLFKTYFKQGGMQVQFTIQDAELLMDAKKHPEKYPDLMVRISGYTAYFNDLSDRMKDEIINRALVTI